MKTTRTPMQLLDMSLRLNTFKEVSLGYTEQEALTEASRCLNCKKASCVSGCPVNVNIPLFISMIKEGKIEEAKKEINKQNSFGGICSRVCPQETQCEGNCVLNKVGNPIAIGRLERFASEYNIERNELSNNSSSSIEKNGLKVAVVGSGPSSLSFASTALKEGFEVEMFEALHKAGGVLVYGIPEFRLPKEIVNREINQLIDQGLKLNLNTVVGKTITLEELKEKYDYVYIATGAGLPRFMNIPGENLNGVLSSNEFLTRVNLLECYKENVDTPLKKYKNVVVVGGGNVAMDCARCAKRLGSNVYLVYRRGMDEMPARKEEIENAKDEGIVFFPLTNPKMIIGNDLGKVTKILCDKMALGDTDSSGRRAFKVLEGETLELDCDSVIMAIGNTSNPILKNNTSIIEFDQRGLIVTNECNQTTIDTIYAGGDIVTGAATVISAMGTGKRTALEISKRCKI